MARVDLTDEDREIVAKVRRAYDKAKSEHDSYRRRWDGFFELYSGYRKWAENQKDRPDRDVRRSARKEWGADLHIPIVFRTVETVAPRISGHRLSSYILPRDKDALGNVEHMRTIVDAQAEQCGYPLTQQEVAKDGLMYGLGVQKTYWRHEEKVAPIVSRDFYGQGWKEDTRDDNVDDPWAEWVDPFLFLWDPLGFSIETCRYVIQRSFRDSDYVRAKVASKEWPVTYDVEDLITGASSPDRTDVYDARLRAEGQSPASGRLDAMHEVWEYHDGNRVIVVLDGEVPVLNVANPDRCKPFQIFRPTVRSGRMVGIGEVEPIEDLQIEMNTLRSQRRDAAALALGRPLAFDESMVDADDLANSWGPGKALPVNGSPRDFLMQLQVSDVPASGYQEAEEIRSDIDATSGINEAISGGTSGDMTATGAQLSSQAAGKRIDSKRDRFLREVVLPTSSRFVALNQARIADTREMVVPGTNGWNLVELTPAELQGRFVFKIDDDASKAENVPQDRSDAQMLMGLKQDPSIDQQKLSEMILTKLGIKDPRGWVVGQQVPVELVAQFEQMLDIPAGAFQEFMAAQEAQNEANPQDATAQAGATGPVDGPPSDVAGQAAASGQPGR